MVATPCQIPLGRTARALTAARGTDGPRLTVILPLTYRWPSVSSGSLRLPPGRLRSTGRGGVPHRAPPGFLRCGDTRALWRTAVSKRTFQPNNRRRAKTHGFRLRMRTRAGRAIIAARRRKGRAELSA